MPRSRLRYERGRLPLSKMPSDERKPLPFLIQINEARRSGASLTKETDALCRSGLSIQLREPAWKVPF